METQSDIPTRETVLFRLFWLFLVLLSNTWWSVTGKMGEKWESEDGINKRSKWMWTNSIMSVTRTLKINYSVQQVLIPERQSISNCQCILKRLIWAYPKWHFLICCTCGYVTLKFRKLKTTWLRNLRDHLHHLQKQWLMQTLGSVVNNT